MLSFRLTLLFLKQLHQQKQQPRLAQAHHIQQLPLLRTQHLKQASSSFFRPHAGYVLVRGDGLCCFHLAGVIGQLCSDPTAVDSGKTSCSEWELDLTREHIIYNFTRWRDGVRAKLVSECPKVSEPRGCAGKQGVPMCIVYFKGVPTTRCRAATRR